MALLERSFLAGSHTMYFRSSTSKNPCKRLDTRIMLQTEKLENAKIEMDRLNTEILGLCETNWGGNDDFTSDQYRVIHSGKQKGKARVAVILSRK